MVFVRYLCGCLCFITILSSPFISAQFPAVCVQNATLPNATCCPIPPGHNLPCGGPGRGHCIQVQDIDDLGTIPEINRQDDRLNWPTNFFRYVCNCVGKFYGYMCHECWYGYSGPKCNQPVKNVRKSVKSLTVEEKQHFVSLLEESAKTESDYVILNTTHKTTDPAINPQFLSVSVYQYLSYLHYYVSRKTIFTNDSLCDDPAILHPDMAHEGPAFPPWHRLYSLKWERALQQIAGNDAFALPYWDWIDDGGTCEVCSNDLFGETNFSDPLGGLSSESVFSTWQTWCQPPASGCDICDPYIDGGPIIRRPGDSPQYTLLPTRASVDYTLSLDVYDLPPYSKHSLNTTFRNVLEGFANADGPSIEKSDMHNLVHNFLNGTMSELVTAATDPIFIVHHAFIDKLFEVWIRQTKAANRELPLVGAQPGHNRNSFLVPFFPLESVYEYYEISDKMGYEYDDLKMDYQRANDKEESNPLHPGVTASIVLAAFLVIILVILLAVVVKFYRRAK